MEDVLIPTHEALLARTPPILVDADRYGIAWLRGGIAGYTWRERAKVPIERLVARLEQ